MKNITLYLWPVLICVWMCAGSSSVSRAETRLLDLDTGAVTDIGDAFRSVTNLSEIHGVTALDAVPGNGDDWLLVEGAGADTALSEIVCIDARTFTELFRVSETDFRGIFGLPAGDGICSGIHLESDMLDTLLYYDAVYGDWYFLDVTTAETGIFSALNLPEPFYAGFSYTETADMGLLARNKQGFWWFEAFPMRNPVDLDMTALFGSAPVHVSEFEMAFQSNIFRWVIGVTDETAPGTATPTPTPGPGTPTATPTPPPAEYDVVVVHGGTSENLWRIHAGDYSVDPAVVNTGAAANHIVAHQGELFVVNSLSHSVTVYDADTLAFKREMSTGIGKNPFAMAFVDNDHFYVTQFNANEVTRINAYTGEITGQIEMPADLPADPGETTVARPGGLVVAGDTAYVACSNLNDAYLAGGPGVIVRIDIRQDRVTGWTESGGRNCLGVFADAGWQDRIWITNAGDYTPGSGFDGNGTISIYTISTGTVSDSIPVSDAPFEITFTDTRAYFSSAAEGRVGRLNLSDLSVMPPVTLPGAGQGINYVSGMKIGPDGRLWVLEFNHDMLYTLDTKQNDTVIHEITVGDGPDDLIIVE